MGLLIDGSLGIEEKESRLKNIGVWPRIAVAAIAVVLGVFTIVMSFIHDDINYNSRRLAISETFVDDFFLSGYEDGSDACNSINLTNSYETCVVYYDEVFYPNYKDVHFEYKIKFGHGSYQHKAFVIIKNPTSKDSNFTYTEIQFNIVGVKRQDRYYELDEETNRQVLINEGFENVVLFQSITFVE